MLSGTAGTWRRWSERGAGPQDCPAEPHLPGTQGRSKALGAAGSGRDRGLTWWSSTGSKAWPGMQYPTVLKAPYPAAWGEQEFLFLPLWRQGVDVQLLWITSNDAFNISLHV